MIVERNIFHLHFGHAREGLAAMKEMMSLGEFGSAMRILTDETGDAYRLILEITFESYSQMETKMKELDVNTWREKYQQFIPHCMRSYREYLRVVE